MLSQLLKEIIETFRDPRGYTRTVLLPRGQSVRDSSFVAGLATTLNMLQVAALLTLSDASFQQDFAELSDTASLGDETMIAFTFLDLVFLAGAAAVVQVVVLSIGGTLVGRMFGGIGTFSQITSVVAWHALCIVIASIVASILELALGPSIGGLVAVGILFYSFWLLASLLGEAHGFERTGIVLLGLFASIAGFAMLAGLVMGVGRAMFGVG